MELTMLNLIIETSTWIECSYGQWFMYKHLYTYNEMPVSIYSHPKSEHKTHWQSMAKILYVLLNVYEYMFINHYPAHIQHFNLLLSRCIYVIFNIYTNHTEEILIHMWMYTISLCIYLSERDMEIPAETRRSLRGEERDALATRLSEGERWWNPSCVYDWTDLQCNYLNILVQMISEL